MMLRTLCWTMLFRSAKSESDSASTTRSERLLIEYAIPHAGADLEILSGGGLHDQLAAGHGQQHASRSLNRLDRKIENEAE